LTSTSSPKVNSISRVKIVTIVVRARLCRGNYLATARIFRIGITLFCPTFVLGNIVLSDQVHRDQNRVVDWLFALKEIVTNFAALCSLHITIQCSSGRDQAVFILEERHDVALAIHTDNEKLRTMCLGRCQLRANGLLVVDAEDRIDFRKRC
jgi:hypothetical protein